MLLEGLPQSGHIARCELCQGQGRLEQWSPAQIRTMWSTMWTDTNGRMAPGQNIQLRLRRLWHQLKTLRSNAAKRTLHPKQSPRTRTWESRLSMRRVTEDCAPWWCPYKEVYEKGIRRGLNGGEGGRSEVWVETWNEKTKLGKAQTAISQQL